MINASVQHDAERMQQAVFPLELFALLHDHPVVGGSWEGFVIETLLSTALA